MSAKGEVPLMKREVSGGGDPVILLPGGFTGWLSWKPHAEILANSRQVVCVQPHSVELGLQNTPLPSNYSVNFEVNALGKTLDDLAIEQADFAGWSYGSVITLSYALHNPHRVRSLTLIEPSTYWVLDSQGSLPDQLLDEQKYMQTLDMDDVSEEKLMEFMHVMRLISEDVDPRTLAQWPLWSEHRHSLRIGDAEFRHKEKVELVRTFSKPVLLVEGENSNLRDIIAVLGEAFPNVRVEIFPGGHAPHIVSMQPFMERFDRFLSTHN